ncbi:hypothetical protein KAR91_76020 [Candidatus Pacearchaeota archaeon]|nr:hypothetical protein [Candidatus Pacearchaeota archaeon]
MEAKKLDFKMEDGKFVILVDPNADGEPLLRIMINLSEVPDEIVSLFKKD